MVTRVFLPAVRLFSSCHFSTHTNSPAFAIMGHDVPLADFISPGGLVAPRGCSMNGHSEVVKLLLEHGAEVDRPTKVYFQGSYA